MALTLSGTNGISGVDGSASAASIRGTDSNTGVSFSSDTVNVNTAGSTRVTITDNETKITGLNGNITTNQFGHLFLQNTNNSSSNFWGISPRDSGVLDIGYGSKSSSLIAGDVVTLATDGNVGVGKSSTSLDIDGFIIFGNGQAVQAVKSGSGGKILTLNRRTNVGLSIEFFRGSGSSVGSISHNNTSTAFNTTSDYRLKENVVTLSDGITRLKTLKPYRFNFIADKDTTVDGFLAHEVTAVPEAVTGTKDAVITQAMVDNKEYEEERLGEILPQGIDQAKLVPLLTAALQEAIGKIETLETKVAALEAG